MKTTWVVVHFKFILKLDSLYTIYTTTLPRLLVVITLLRQSGELHKAMCNFVSMKMITLLCSFFFILEEIYRGGITTV